MVGRDVHPTATATPQENAIYAFTLQSAPAAIDAAMLYPDRGGCKWMGVGGQVVDLQGRPVTGISVMLGGSAESRPFDQTSLTGTALKYGEAGYEFTLAQQRLVRLQRRLVGTPDRPAAAAALAQDLLRHLG